RTDHVDRNVASELVAGLQRGDSACERRDEQHDEQRTKTDVVRLCEGARQPDPHLAGPTGDLGGETREPADAGERVEHDTASPALQTDNQATHRLSTARLGSTLPPAARPGRSSLSPMHIGTGAGVGLQVTLAAGVDQPAISSAARCNWAGNT